MDEIDSDRTDRGSKAARSSARDTSTERRSGMSLSQTREPSVEHRLAAVERALSDGDPIDRRDRLDELERRLAELEAAVQALRGYVGTVRAVNDDVEHRADLALRKVTALERHVSPDESQTVSVPDDGDGSDGSDRSDGSNSRRVVFGDLRDAL